MTLVLSGAEEPLLPLPHLGNFGRRRVSLLRFLSAPATRDVLWN